MTAGARIGLFGGSFDPVHLGHIHVARAAQSARGLERVIWMPAARPPHKPGRVLAGSEDRVRMLELAIRGEPRWSVSRLELEREGPSYTIDTVRALPAHLGLRADTPIDLLLGGDNLEGLATWRDARELFSLVQPVIVVRRGDEPELCRRLARELSPELATRLQAAILVAPIVAISSTELREALLRGESPADRLPGGVLEYIRARHLYDPRVRP